MDYEGAYSQKLTQDLCTILLLVWDNFKLLQDQWVMKGHTHRSKSGFMYYNHLLLTLDNFKMNGL